VSGFTNHDTSFIFEGVLYAATRGVSISTVAISAENSVDNLEMTGTVLGVTSEQEIDAGRWDGAEVLVFEVNWAELSQGKNRLKRGTIGQITVDGEKFTAEIRGLSQYLQTSIGEVCSKFCKADLFDERCKVPETEGVWKFTAVPVTKVTSYREMEFSLVSPPPPDDFFTNGKIQGVAGENTGITREVQTHTGNLIKLFEDMPYAIHVGDTFTVWAGCQKRFLEDCHNKFNNDPNFRGFPYLPGLDEALAGAS